MIEHKVVKSLLWSLWKVQGSEIERADNVAEIWNGWKYPHKFKWMKSTTDLDKRERRLGFCVLFPTQLQPFWHCDGLTIWGETTFTWFFVQANVSSLAEAEAKARLDGELIDERQSFSINKRWRLQTPSELSGKKFVITRNALPSSQVD